MKAGDILILGGIGLGVWYLSRLGLASGTASVIFENIEIKSLTHLQLNLRVQNVSNASLTVNSMTGYVTLNDQDFGNVSYFPAGGLVIPANGYVLVPVDLQISIMDLPANISAILNSGGTAANVAIDGFINLNGFVLPLAFDKALTV